MSSSEKAVAASLFVLVYGFVGYYRLLAQTADTNHSFSVTAISALVSFSPLVLVTVRDIGKKRFYVVGTLCALASIMSLFLIAAFAAALWRRGEEKTSERSVRKPALDFRADEDSLKNQDQVSHGSLEGLSPSKNALRSKSQPQPKKYRVDSPLKRRAKHEIRVGSREYFGSVEALLEQSPSDVVTLLRSANAKLTIRKKQRLFVIEFIDADVVRCRTRPRNREFVLSVVEDFLRLRDPSDIVVKL